MAKRKCPTCAEQVRADAKVCRFCGRGLPPLSRSEIFVGGLPGLLGIGAIIFLLYQCSTVSQGPPKPAVSTVPVNDPAKCEQVIEVARKSGLVMDRPATRRVNVNERIWAATSADEKRVLLQMVACAAHGGRALSQLGLGESAVAYGYHSGKRLALASSVGVSLEE